jgi:hypothetical protein
MDAAARAVSKSDGIRQAACHECVAVYLERVGLTLALGAAERVDRLASQGCRV